MTCCQTQSLAAAAYIPVSQVVVRPPSSSRGSSQITLQLVAPQIQLPFGGSHSEGGSVSKHDPDTAGRQERKRGSSPCAVR
jgi:hypothetical protein